MSPRAQPSAPKCRARLCTHADGSRDSDKTRCSALGFKQLTQGRGTRQALSEPHSRPRSRAGQLGRLRPQQRTVWAPWAALATALDLGHLANDQKPLGPAAPRIVAIIRSFAAASAISGTLCWNLLAHGWTIPERFRCRIGPLHSTPRAAWHAHGSSTLLCGEAQH